MHAAHGNYKVRVVRPLLGIHKEQLLELCQANAVEWVEDPTNKNLSFTRNFIRDLLEHHGTYESLSEEPSWEVAEELPASSPEPEATSTPTPSKPLTLAEQAKLSQYPTKDIPAESAAAAEAAPPDASSAAPALHAVEGPDAITTADPTDLNASVEEHRDSQSIGTDATVLPGESGTSEPTARPIAEEHDPLVSTASSTSIPKDDKPTPVLPTYVPKFRRQQPPTPPKRRSHLTLADHLAGVLAPTEVAGRRQEASLGRLDLEFETAGPRSKQPAIFGGDEGGQPTVLGDVLRLQGSCTDARNEFGERAAEVLKQAVVSGRGNIAHLPVLQINGCLVDVAPIAATDPGTAQRAIGAILQVRFPFHTLCFA